MKTSLFGIIVLMVLIVSVHSAFDSAYADDEDPIRIVLDITYQNILETREDVDDVSENAETLFATGQDEYFEALSALDAGDTEAARDHALIAMALFEDATEEIGEFEGFEDEDIDIQSEIPGQFTFNNIFKTQEQISELELEFEELKELSESNWLGFDFTEFEETISSAYEDLAKGNTDDVKEQLGSIEDIAVVYEQMNEKAVEDQEERAEEFGEELAEKIENALDQDLGLTEESIEQMEATLEVLQTGDAETIIASTSENSEFAQEVEENEIEEELGEPETETDEGAETETDEGAETETDEGNLFDAGLDDSLENKGHDYFEYSFEASVDDTFEVNYDGTPEGEGGQGEAGSEEGEEGSGGSGGTTNNNVNIGSGDTVTISGQTINGNIIMTGGTLTITGSSTINGNVEVTGGSLTINGSTLVTGNIDVDGSDPVTIQNININGNVEVANSLNVVITGNTINGSLINSGGNPGCNVFGNFVNGDNTTFNCTLITAVNDYLAYTAQDTDIVISVLANDGGESPLMITGTTNGNDGTTSDDGTTVTYNPDPAFIGTDTFTYTFEDATTASAIGNVTVIADAYTSTVTGNPSGLTVGNGEYVIVWDNTIIDGNIVMTGGILTLTTGTTANGNVDIEDANAVTITGSTITGNVELKDSTNITITGNTINGNIVDQGGNAQPCDISSNTASWTGSCSGNSAPTANAGPDQSVTEGTTVNIDGSGSTDDGTIGSYSLVRIDSNGESITLNGANTVTPSFDSTSSGSSVTYVFELTVTDNGVPALQDTDSINITTNPPGGGTSGSGTLVVVDGFDEESGEGLVASGKISLVTSSDDSRFETKAGYYTDYYLTNTIVPVGATSITSLIFYVEHNEESSFGVGNLVWLTDSNTVSTTPTLIIDNDGTTSWDVPVGSITPADVNSLVFLVQNNDVANGKLTKVDYIYADVDWLE